MWILNEIEKHQSKNFKTKIIIWIIISFIWIYSWYSYFFTWSNSKQEINEIKNFTVKTWNLKTSISWDWKVLYKEDYNINFPISGIVKEISKNEWSEVNLGDIIAKLDTTYLEISLDKSKANLEKTIADLNAKKYSNSKNDINLAERQVETSKINFENSKITWNNDLINSENILKNAEIAYKALIEEESNFWNFNNTDLESLNLSIEVTKNDLEIAIKNLELIKIQETEKYNNLLKDWSLQIDNINTYIEKYLYSIDKLLWVTKENKRLNDSFEDYLWTKNSIFKNTTISNFREINNNFSEFKNNWEEIKNNDFNEKEITKYINQAEDLTNKSIKLLENSLLVLKNSIVNINFTQNTVDSYIWEYENDIINLKKQLSDFENLKQNISEQKVNLETKIKLQQNLILSLKSKLKSVSSSLDKFGNSTTNSKNILEEKINIAKSNLEKAKNNYENIKNRIWKNILLAEKQVTISEISLNDKVSGPTKTELAPYYANVKNARIAVKEAEEKLKDGVLRSPISWKIVKINGNIWAFVWWDKDTYFVTVINNDNFYIESYVEELDISRIKVWSKVYLTFDALEWVQLKWKVDFISEKSTIDSNWIVTYKVEISFNKKNSWVREWMTTYVEYITNEVKNVQIIPVEAVKPVKWKPSIMLENWEWKSVITWFTDSKMVEIISGLKVWDKIKY